MCCGWAATRTIPAWSFPPRSRSRSLWRTLPRCCKAPSTGGNGFKTPEGELSAWYAVDGIHIAPGRSAEYVRSAQVIAWQDAAAHISQLMDSGAYASNVELAEAGQHERMQLAQALWYLKHDLSDEAREQGNLSCMDTLRGGGFPDETARLAEQLTNTDFRETLSGEFA